MLWSTGYEFADLSQGENLLKGRVVSLHENGILGLRDLGLAWFCH